MKLTIKTVNAMIKDEEQAIRMYKPFAQTSAWFYNIMKQEQEHLYSLQALKKILQKKQGYI